MPRLPAAERPPPASSSGPPDTVGLLAATLDEWQRIRRQRLPPPLPFDSREAARWWLDVMQEPERPGETRDVAVGEKTRRELGYFVRCRTALLNFLRLDRAGRETVVAGIEDGIPYRGDDLPMYMRIVRETERQQELGPELYRAGALEDLGRLGL